MREAENVNFSLGINNENLERKRVRQTTYKDIVEFIKSKELPPEDEKKLLDHAKKIPSGSLLHFKKNYQIYLRKNERN